MTVSYWQVRILAAVLFAGREKETICETRLLVLETIQSISVLHTIYKYVSIYYEQKKKRSILIAASTPIALEKNNIYRLLLVITRWINN